MKEYCTGLNSVAAAIYEDWIKQSMNGITDSRAALINKVPFFEIKFNDIVYFYIQVLTVAAGIVTTGFAFSGDALGGVMKVFLGMHYGRAPPYSYQRA